MWNTRSLCWNFKQRSVFLTSHLIGQITRTQFLLRGWIFFPYMETKCKAKRRAEQRVHVSEYFSVNFTSFQWKWWVKYLVDSIIVLRRVCCFGFAATGPNETCIESRLHWIFEQAAMELFCFGCFVRSLPRSVVINKTFRDYVQGEDSKHNNFVSIIV